MSPSKNSVNKKLAVISGSGGLPLKVSENAFKQGWDGIIINLTDLNINKIRPNWNVFNIKIGKVSQIFKRLHIEKVTHIVLCGGIERPKLQEIKFDLKGLDIMSKIAFKGDDAALRVLSLEIEKEGFIISSASDFLDNSLVPKGHYAGPKPLESISREIERGYNVLVNLSQSDVGQSVAVQNGLVLAVEAIEGTDLMLKRVQSLKLPGIGPILVKAPKVNQDLRFDQPVIGIQTVKNAIKSGFSCIACKHNEVLIVDIGKVIRLANSKSLTLIGF